MSYFQRSFPSGIALATAITVATVSCSKDAVDPSGSGSHEHPANATVTLLTDGPFPFSQIARADVYVVSVSGSLSADTGSTATGFVTLATPKRRINVLELQNGLTTELGAVTVPKGAISAVRMVIDTDSSSITLKSGAVLTSHSTPGIAWQSSAGRPTLDAVIHEQILVPDSGAVVVIDFDLGRMFYPVNGYNASGGFIFMPQLRAADANRTGAVSGTVRAGSPSGIPVVDASLRLFWGKPGASEGTWSELAFAKSDSTGAFKFTLVIPTAYWTSRTAFADGTYILSADSPVGGGLSRILMPNLSVTAAGELKVGTLVLP